MKSKTFNISMPDKLVKKIDRQARAQGSNRSDFIRQAVRKELTIFEQWEQLTKAARAQYKGPKLSEEQVADIVREYRRESSQK